MSSFWVYTLLPAIVSVVGVNVLLGGYLFLSFVSTLAQTGRFAPWMIAYTVGCGVFVIGIGLFLDGGGIWFLCANVLILSLARVLSRRQWLAQTLPSERGRGRW